MFQSHRRRSGAFSITSEQNVPICGDNFRRLAAIEGCWRGDQVCPGNDLSSIQVQGFLDGHNWPRAMLAQGKFTVGRSVMPSAADMEQMQWDCNLAASAAKYAATCPSGHSHWRGMGENLFWRWSTQPFDANQIPQMATDSWINEFQQYGWPSIQFDGKHMNIGHATQMMWSSTNRVGCAIGNCPKRGFPFGVAVVCQYSPQGNIISLTNFQPGSTCSACRGICNAKTGLCM